ncbi:hypothetical protein M422DRAFT_26201 [Sphaerobolus stellatus SS14]|nr:hypothetical protein M422DRAFT_26201 [Sphaerobolus stellatus SS14]
MSVTKPHVPPPTIVHERTKAVADEEQEKKRVGLLEYVSDPAYKIPGFENGELEDKEKFWLSNECLLRFLRASSWDLKTAKRRIDETLKWRREFGIYDLKAEDVEPEAVTGKEIIFGYDKEGRPGMYLIPSRQNTDGQTRQIQFTFWALERTIDLMAPGVENIALFINFGDRAKNPSMGTARKVLNILQSHYAERLGLALIINIPYLVTLFLNLIFPFVDPVTRAKIKINPKVVEDGIIESEETMKEWGGSVEFEYKHEEYWQELVKICETRRTSWFERWKALGGKIGTSEWDYKQEAAASQPEAVSEALATDGNKEA